MNIFCGALFLCLRQILFDIHFKVSVIFSILKNDEEPITCNVLIVPSSRTAASRVKELYQPITFHRLLFYKQLSYYELRLSQLLFTDFCFINNLVTTSWGLDLGKKMLLPWNCYSEAYSEPSRTSNMENG